MSYPFEQLRATSDNLQFPGGDIGGRQEMAGLQLYHELTSGDEESQLTKLSNLRRSEIGQWRSFPNQEPVYQSIRQVAKNWGHTYLDDTEYAPGEDESEIGQGHRIVAVGAYGMLAFVKKSHLLPVNFTGNLSDELDRMAQFDSEQIHSFADNSWTNMHASHPRIYEQIAPFSKYLSELFRLQNNEDELVLLDAATALPYMLSATSRMDNYLGIAIEDRNVDRTIERLRVNA